MNLNAQLDAFKAKHPEGGMKNLMFTLTLPDGMRTLLANGNELALLEYFTRTATNEPVESADADHDSGYYVAGVDVLACECGDGLRCEKVKVTPYD